MNESNYNGDVESNNFARPPPPEPMMSRDSDEVNPGLDQGHSLPSVAEARLSMASTAQMTVDEEGQPYPSKQRCSVFFISFVLAVVVIAASIGIAVGMQNRNNDDGSKARTMETRAFLSAAGISEPQMMTEQSPHNEALKFITGRNGFSSAIPTDINTPEGYDLMSRYVLALFYFSVNGPAWRHNLNFLASSSPCEWYRMFRNSNGGPVQVGVYCDPNTNQVQSLSLGEFAMLL